jgi:hypothetical protein
MSDNMVIPRCCFRTVSRRPQNGFVTGELEGDPAPRLRLTLRTAVGGFAEFFVGFGVFQPDAGHVDPAVRAGDKTYRWVVSDQFGKLHVMLRSPGIKPAVRRFVPRTKIAQTIPPVHAGGFRRF